MLPHPVSLRMRNKGLIITDDLSLSFCQFGLYVLFCARRKQNNPEILSVFSEGFLSHQPRLLFHKLKLSTSDASPASIDGHCAHWLSLKHSIIQWSVCPSSPQTTVLMTTHSQGILTVFIECSLRAHIKTLNQFHSHLHLLSSNSYFPSLSPFYHFFWG